MYQPLCSALPAARALCVCRCAAVTDTITDTITDTAVLPAALDPQHHKLTLVLHFVSAELPPPCGAFCTSERVAPEGKVQTVLCSCTDKN